MGGSNKVSRQMREAAARTGKLPHELLLELARGNAVPGIPKPKPEVVMDALKAAAPYYAPRLLGAVVRTNPGESNPWTEILSLTQGKSRGLPAEASKRAAAR